MKRSSTAMRVSGHSKQLLLCVNLIVLLTSEGSGLQQKRRDAQPAQTQENITPQEAAQFEAVITTDLGVIRFEFFADKAPKHSAEFIKQARASFYNGSAFHRLLPRAIIQGGDPLVKDPQTPRAKWGTGGF